MAREVYNKLTVSILLIWKIVIVAICATLLNLDMILSFKHKGLQKFYETGSKAGIQAKHEKRMRLMLSALDTATRIDDMDIPSFKLHPLTGSRKEIWSISVSGNWRLTFRFEDGNAHIVNYEDYH